MVFSPKGFALATLLFSCFSSCLLSGLAAPSVAQSAEQPLSIHKLTLRDAIAATLAKNPQLSSFSFRRAALAGELQTAGLKPALRVSGELENIAGSGDYTGSKAAELTLALSSVIELGDKRAARLGVVSERQQQLAVQQQILELDLLAEVTRRFIDVAAAQEQLALQQATAQLSADTSAAIKHRVDAGNTPDAELARAQAKQARLSIAARQAQVQLDSAKLRLAALWGATAVDFSSVSAELLKAEPSAPLPDLLAQLQANPDIQAFASEARLREAELRLALSQRNTDIEWSAGVRRLQTSKDSALVLGLSVPLSSGSRAAGAIATAQANQQLTDTERDTALLKLRAQLSGLYQEREAALDEMTSLRTQVIPPLQNALKATRAAFDKGRYGYLELSSAQQELLDAQAALIAAAANSHQLRTEIERLSGTASTHLDSEVSQ